MQVKEIMTSKIETVDKDTTLQQAAEKMGKSDVGALPVFEGDHLIGIVTDRDIAVRGVARRLPSDRATVGEVMSEKVRCVFEDTPVDEAAENMAEHQVRRVVVFDHDRNPKGFLSLADLALEDSGGQLCGQVLKKISRPTREAARV